MSFKDISEESVRKVLAGGVIFLDFDGVLTDNTVYVGDDGSEFVRCSKYDSQGLQIAKRAGFRFCVISSEKNSTVKRRCDKLKIPCYYGVEDKVDAARRHCLQHSVELENCWFVGNDMNDLSLSEQVCSVLCPADAHPDFLRRADAVSTFWRWLRRCERVN